MALRALPPDLDEKLRGVALEFAAHGPDLHLSDVAIKANIPRATLYYHFRGKDDLRAQLLSYVVQANGRAIAQAIDGDSDADVLLARILGAHVRFLSDNADVSRAIFGSLTTYGDLSSTSTLIRELVQRPILEVLVTGESKGTFREGVGTATTVAAILGMATIAVLHHVIDGESFDVAGLVAEVQTLGLRTVLP